MRQRRLTERHHRLPPPRDDTTTFGMTATEFVLLNNTDRDALREPWPVRPFALELQENHKVRVTLLGLRKLPYTCLNDVTHVNYNNIYINSFQLQYNQNQH